jgi:hypothetical protein
LKILFTTFYKTRQHDEEFNGTEPSTSVNVPRRAFFLDKDCPKARLIPSMNQPKFLFPMLLIKLAGRFQL